MEQRPWQRLRGAGLGLRRAFMDELADAGEASLRRIDFMEVAPENWIDVGGRLGWRFRQFTERFPFVCHGLSLSLGGPTPLDTAFLKDVKRFLDAHQIGFYSEHLSACSDDGHLYDLMPIPFTAEAVFYVAERIRRVQDVLERRIGIENVSCYATPGAEMGELEFINAVLEEADCMLLLDVNNIHVNSVNFNYDPSAFLHGLHGERAAYIHVAGHRQEAADLRVDSHGATVIDPVWRLLDEAYALYGKLPTLLERDFNMPPLAALLDEVQTIRSALGDTPAALRAQPAPDLSANSQQRRIEGRAERSTNAFQKTQREFAAYIRDPKGNPLPTGVEDRRANIYARLFYNNIETFLAGAFSVLRRLLDDAAWDRLMHGFLHEHRAQSPYFSHIPKEFLGYLAALPGSDALPPFAWELCHYQWVRRALSQAPDIDFQDCEKAIGLDDAALLSPLAWPLRYAFPVQRIGPEFQPREAPAQPTYLIAARDREHRVRFISSNAATARLLRLIDEGEGDAGKGSSVRRCLETIAEDLGAPLERIEAFGLQTLRRLQQLDVVQRSAS